MALCMLECLIGFLPVFKSRRLVQQQPIPACKMKAIKANPVPSHMKMNILIPTLAWMLSDDCAVAAYLKTKLMTDAITDPAKMTTKVRPEMMDMGREIQREKMAMGERMERQKARMVPARKKANMRCEHSLRMSRICVSSVGKAIVAPARSSFRMTDTISNQ